MKVQIDYLIEHYKKLISYYDDNNKITGYNYSTGYKTGLVSAYKHIVNDLNIISSVQNELSE